MNLKEMRDYIMSLLVFKCVNGIAPSYLYDVLMPAASINARVNRSTADDIQCCMCHTTA